MSGCKIQTPQTSGGKIQILKLQGAKSNHPRFIKFQKNSIKIQKIKKHHFGFISSQNETGKAENE